MAVIYAQNVDWFAQAAQHGYAVTAGLLFLAALGLPLPVMIGLLAAGAAAHGGLRPELLFVVAWLAALSGDTLLYLGGRYTGWWLLSRICWISINPERCIFTSAEAFYKRGPLTLLFAKFVPGLGMVAAPLAGSLNMRLPRFLRLMAVGEALYCGVWLTAGYACYRYVGRVMLWVEDVGHTLMAIALTVVGAYLAMILFFMWRSRRYRLVERISAEGLQERIEHLGEDQLVVIADVRSHNYYDPGMHRIKNSIRLEPHRLEQELTALKEFMAPDCEVYLYCSCIRDTTSVRVAHALKKANLRTTVIEGGIKAWARAGGDLEPVPEADLKRLPMFD